MRAAHATWSAKNHSKQAFKVDLNYEPHESCLPSLPAAWSMRLIVKGFGSVIKLNIFPSYHQTSFVPVRKNPNDSDASGPIMSQEVDDIQTSDLIMKRTWKLIYARFPTRRRFPCVRSSVPKFTKPDQQVQVRSQRALYGHHTMMQMSVVIRRYIPV